MTPAQIFDVFDNERTYQKRRWGNEDGSEAQHSDGNYVVFIDHYLGVARAELSTKAGSVGALEALRKVASLAIAALQQKGYDYRKELANTPLFSHPPDGDLGDYVLRIEMHLKRLKDDVLNLGVITNGLCNLIACCVRCFSKFGVPDRSLAVVVNARTGRTFFGSNDPNPTFDAAA